MEGDRITVCVLMGSDSDWKIMKAAADTLDEFEIPYDVRVLSAHRSLALVQSYVSDLPARGAQVVICGAGGAAHLAGVVASLTSLPVIGVPLRAWALDGLDALLSTVQMPPGVPVATVAVDGARNAALLAVQILALADADLKSRWEVFRASLEKSVLERDRKVQRERGNRG